MKKNKIALVTDTWFPIIGGGPQVVLAYAKNLSRYYDIDIITRNLGEYPYQSLEDDLKKRGVRIIKLISFGDWNNIFGRLLFILTALVVLVKNRYNLIHSFPFLAGIPSYIAARITRVMVIYSVFALSDRTDSIGNKLVSLIEKCFSFKIPYDLIITDNYQLSRQVSNKRIKFIPNGVDIHSFDRVKAKKWPNVTGLYVGRYHQQKGISNLLKALPAIFKKRTDFRLALIGYGEMESEIKTFVKKNRLVDKVRMLPVLYGEQLIRQYKKAHFLILPSLYEGFGIVILEAWAAKIPVLSSSVGSLSKIIKDNYNGFLLKDNRQEILEQSVISMIDNLHKDMMGNRGYQIVKKDYQWDKITNEVYQVYQKLLK